MRRTHGCFSLKEFLKEVTKVRYCLVHVVSKNRTLYPHLLIRMPQRLFMHMIILIGSSKPTYLQLQVYSQLNCYIHRSKWYLTCFCCAHYQTEHSKELEVNIDKMNHTVQHYC